MIPLQRQPIHPGEILWEDFLKEYHLAAPQLAVRLGVSYSTIRNILRGKGRITPNIALRLSKFFGTSAEVWLGMQNEFDLYLERTAYKEDIQAITPMDIARETKLFS
jgi:addiction module HigA family antidote